MGSDRTWLVSFESAATPDAAAITRALTTLPLAKIDASRPGTWLLRVGRGEVGIGLSTEAHVLAESQERAEVTKDRALASVLERADARFEVWFDERDEHWFEAALEHATLRLAALTGGVVHTYWGELCGAVATRPTTLRGERLAALTAAVRASFPHATDSLIEDVRQPFFARWSIARVTTGRPGEHFHLACDEDARVVVLTDRPDGLVEVIAGEPAATVETASAATLYATHASAWTAPPTAPPRFVTSFDEIPLRARLGSADQAFVDIARRDHGASIGPPRAERLWRGQGSSGDEWRVTSWYVGGDALYRREIVVSQAGRLATATLAVCTGLPLAGPDLGAMSIA